MAGNYNREDVAKLLLRLSVGILMLFHGYSKVVNPGALDWIGGTLTAYGMPAFFSYGVYVGEILAPLMIIIGVYTRPGGWFIFINMVFALFLAHTGDFFTVSEHGGWAVELQWFYLIGGLVVALLGSGKFAVKPD